MIEVRRLRWLGHAASRTDNGMAIGQTTCYEGCELGCEGVIIIIILDRGDMGFIPARLLMMTMMMKL